MATTLEVFEKTLDPIVVEQAEQRANEILQEMSLANLRKFKGVRQEDLAVMLHTKQPNVSQIEKRKDINISTLMAYVHALGGKLELVAHFQDGESIVITPPAK